MSNPDLPPDSITTLLQRARELQAPVPDKARLGDLLSRGELSPNDVRWVYLAAQFVEQVITDLEPGTLRSSDDLPDETPLFTTRRLFKALEARVERLEKAVAPPFTTPAGPVTVHYRPAAYTPEEVEAAKRAVLETAAEVAREQQAPTVEVTTSEPDVALYFVCQNRHPLAVRTTTILENGVRRAIHHEVVCPACEADGITEVRLPDLDESDDDD